MTMKIRNDHFATEEEAVAEIKAAGYWPLTHEFPPEKNENHWHDFDSMLFVLEGDLSVTEAETGTQGVLPAGGALEAVTDGSALDQTAVCRSVSGVSAPASQRDSDASRGVCSAPNHGLLPAARGLAIWKEPTVSPICGQRQRPGFQRAPVFSSGM